MKVKGVEILCWDAGWRNYHLLKLSHLLELSDRRGRVVAAHLF